MRILLTGNLFHGYEYDLKDALESLGHKVEMLFNNIHGPFTTRELSSFPDWLRYGFLPFKLKLDYFVKRSVSAYNQSLIKMIRSNSYDMMLVIGAKTIEEEILKAYTGPKVLWFLDSIARYEEVFRKVPLFDKIYLFEPTDVVLIKERFGKESQFLATAFNPAIYHPSPRPKRYDFSFVGSYYPVRDIYLHHLTKISTKLCIYGNFYRSEHKELRQSVKKIMVPQKQANDLYNLTKVNVNIHHSQSKEGLSPRTFEILGSGGFQLVERKKMALEYFKDGIDISLYDSEEEFIDKARFYLHNDREREKIAQNGYQAAISAHTWKHRLAQMLDDL